MELSRRGDYAVRAMLDVATRPVDRMTVTKEIALRQDIPPVFLTKIVSSLSQAGLLRTYRGVAGGVALGKPADQISLLQIIEAVDGPIYINRCLIRPGECDRDRTCPAHELWVQAQGELLGLLANKSLADLARRAQELQQVPTAGFAA
ncbi:MAG: Rrf2 family transcriptional regulator [Chloroflexota bacterium]